MSIDFLIKPRGLEVVVSLISEVPTGSITVWDFGVANEAMTQDTKYTYKNSGRYIITVHIQDVDGNDISTVSKPVMVTEYAKTQLSDTIYNLIDKYIPDNLSVSLTSSDKATYITKWQLYIQPLVNHGIPYEEYSNELYYEGLENQLVMEMAAYDYLYTKIENMLVQTADQLNNLVLSEDKVVESGKGRDRVKQITTGPTEVQFYDTVTESTSTLFKSYAAATQPGGILDDLRKNLCMLSSRVDIYLPICDQPRCIKVPKIVNRRKSGIIGGPNPGRLVKIPKDSLL